MIFRKAPPPDPSLLPIPNYGRGAFFGLTATLVSGIGWAVLIVVTEEFNIGLMLAIGWFIGAAVRWGMGTVDRVGVAITLYGTLLGILIGTCLYIGSIIHEQGGTVTIEGITATFLTALRDFKFLALYCGLALAACWIGVAVCREGMPAPAAVKAGKKAIRTKPSRKPEGDER